jgi:hypothetical protein
MRVGTATLVSLVSFAFGCPPSPSPMADSGDTAPSPPPPPPPPVMDSSPPPPPPPSQCSPNMNDSCWCALACVELNALGCPEGTATTCQSVCEHAQTAHLTNLNPGCLAKAATVAQAQACEATPAKFCVKK